MPAFRQATGPTPALSLFTSARLSRVTRRSRGGADAVGINRGAHEWIVRQNFAAICIATTTTTTAAVWNERETTKDIPSCDPSTSFAMYTEQCPAYDSLSLSAMLSVESAGADLISLPAWSGSPSGYQEYSTLPTLDTDSQWLSQLTESGSGGGSSSSGGASAPKRRGPGRPRPYGHPTPAVGQGSKGGRARKEQQLSAEDQEKMRIRRERNKVAAAKVRTRRQELTDMLEAETAKLAAEQATIRAELQQLQKEREELELMLATHEPACLLQQPTCQLQQPACRLQHPALEQTSPDSTTGSQGLRALRPTNLPLPRLQLKREPHSPLYGQQLLQQQQHHHQQQQQPVARKHEQLSSQLVQPCTQLQPNHEAESAKPLHTPVVSLTPCSGSGSYVFTYPSLAGLQDFLSSESHSCASALRRQSSSGGSGELGAVGSDSLLSPTILSL
ncbi:unnamed protein product [Lampetra fluviatilis]